jgi:hypothetical protein
MVFVGVGPNDAAAHELTVPAEAADPQSNPTSRMGAIAANFRKVSLINVFFISLSSEMNVSDFTMFAVSLARAFQTECISKDTNRGTECGKKHIMPLRQPVESGAGGILSHERCDPPKRSAYLVSRAGEARYNLHQL